MIYVFDQVICLYFSICTNIICSACTVMWALFICISYYLKKKAFFFLCALVLYRFCWDKFGWGGDKSNELLVPVLKEYEKREVRTYAPLSFSFTCTLAHEPYANAHLQAK